MANKATLSVAGHEFNVLEFTINFKQKYDNQGKPASGVFLGDFYLILGAGNDLFFEWLTDQSRMESGTIKTYRTDQDSTFVEYSFEQAFLTSILESHFEDGDWLQNQYNQVGSQENQSDFIEANMNQIRGESNSDTHILTSQRNTLQQFQRRTGNSYCLFVSVSCEKVKVRDVEHDNKWGVS
ncbi:MAG: hypothetical protein H7Y12_07240 [Sphingobacteriaceae bacterium]|nr:hypothetical protein [Cytophagaceae bacterium]